MSIIPIINLGEGNKKKSKDIDFLNNSEYQWEMYAVRGEGSYIAASGDSNPAYFPLWHPSYPPKDTWGTLKYTGNSSYAWTFFRSPLIDFSNFAYLLLKVETRLTKNNSPVWNNCYIVAEDKTTPLLTVYHNQPSASNSYNYDMAIDVSSWNLKGYIVFGGMSIGRTDVDFSEILFRTLKLVGDVADSAGKHYLVKDGLLANGFNAGHSAPSYPAGVSVSTAKKTDHVDYYLNAVNKNVTASHGYIFPVISHPSGYNKLHVEYGVYGNASSGDGYAYAVLSYGTNYAAGSTVTGLDQNIYVWNNVEHRIVDIDISNVPDNVYLLFKISSDNRQTGVRLWNMWLE